MAKRKQQWARGDKGRLARAANISPQYLSDILAERKTCPPVLAGVLEAAAAELGYRITRAEWVFVDLRRLNSLCKK